MQKHGRVAVLAVARRKGTGSIFQKAENLHPAADGGPLTPRSIGAFMSLPTPGSRDFIPARRRCSIVAPIRLL